LELIRRPAEIGERDRAQHKAAFVARDIGLIAALDTEEKAAKNRAARFTLDKMQSIFSSAARRNNLRREHQPRSPVRSVPRGRSERALPADVDRQI
jgi:hypothetical protein